MVDSHLRSPILANLIAPKGEVPLSSTRPTDQYGEIRQLIAILDQYECPLFRELALRRTATFVADLRELAGGKITYENTETWRAAYEQVLYSLIGAEYRSASWVKSDDYWADLPGQQSMKLNYELLGKGLHIERILILGWNLWPPESLLPGRRIRQWIEDQHFRGIDIKLVRENDLTNEPELLRDFGIYADRATGEQETDGESRTVRFVLCFDQASIRLTQDRWGRLLLFARPYGELLDQATSAD